MVVPKKSDDGAVVGDGGEEKNGDHDVVVGGGGEEKHAGKVVVDGAGGKKKTAGRQKISMEKIKDKKKLLVTFSKRRQGLFKKASELSILCGTQIAAIVFSPEANAYSFGSPSVDYIIDRFLDRIPSTKSMSNINSAKVIELQEQLDAVNWLLRSQQGDRAPSSGSNEKGYWWDMEPTNQMSLKQLQEFYHRLAALRNLTASTWGLNL